MNNSVAASKSTLMDPLDFAEKIGCKELHMLSDPDSGLKAIVAIYSTLRGPALGGCRFLPYPSSSLAAIDAIRLAKAMAFKSAIADLPLGGGKAVLISSDQFLHSNNRAKALRAFGRFLNTLNGRYITAVDSGTSVEDMDHIAGETEFVTSTSKFNYSILDPSILTARGVLRGIFAAVKFKYSQNDLKDIHVAVQGAGHVGYNLIKLLYNTQAKISVSDVNSQLLKKCKAEFPNINIIVDPEDIYKLNIDIFSPCALGGILTEISIDKLKAKIIVGAANNQLLHDDCAEYLRQQDILYAPDFVVNAGGIIHVAGPVMQKTEQQTTDKIDDIYNVLLKIFSDSVKQNISTHNIAYNIALDRLQERDPGICKTL